MTAMDTGAAPSFTIERGTVRADALVIAGNALLGEIEPGLKWMIAPVGTYIAVTERLESCRMRQILRDDVAVCDINYVVNYYRRSPDDRLLFGAGISCSRAIPQTSQA